MQHYKPYSIIGFHSCDKEIGLKVINGREELNQSINPWDWLGRGVYFWEENPGRALEYALESCQNKQFNKIPVKTPFVIGAIIELGNCLNLLETESLQILSEAYHVFENFSKSYNMPMPENKGNNRALDCAVIQYIHRSNIENNNRRTIQSGAHFRKVQKPTPALPLLPGCMCKFVF